MTTATQAWPTLAQLTDAARRVTDAHQAIEELGNFSKLAEDLEDIETPIGPTLEELGALSWFVEYAGTDVENMAAYLGEMREARKTASWRIKPDGGDDAS